MKGLILAAGIGSRLKPWTDSHPKALVPLGGIPMLRHAINALLKVDIHDIIINVHHKADQIIEYLNLNPCNNCRILISDETSQLLDTGGAIVKAASIIGDDPVIIYNADIFCTLDLNILKEEHFKRNTDVTMLTSERKSTRQLIFDNRSILKGWINHIENRILPAHLRIENNYIYSSYNGIQIINPSAVSALKSAYPSGPFPIIPAYIQLIDKITISGFTPVDEAYRWVDIGSPEKLENARKIFDSLKILHES